MANINITTRGELNVSGVTLDLQHNLRLDDSIVGVSKKNISSLTPSKVAVAASPEGFEAHQYLNILKQVIEEDTDNLIEGVKCIYGFNVKEGPNGKEGYWEIDTKSGKPIVNFNGTNKADISLTINDKDVKDFVTGKLNPQKAFYQGKIKIKGNMGIAMNLMEFQKKASTRIEQLRSKL